MTTKDKIYRDMFNDLTEEQFVVAIQEHIEGRVLGELEHFLTEINLDTELGLSRLNKRIKQLKYKGGSE